MASLHQHAKQVGDGTSSSTNDQVWFGKDPEPAEAGSTEEWCDSGLGFFSGTQLSIADDIETDSSCSYFTAAPPLTYTAAAEHEIWGPHDFGVSGDGGESCLSVWGSGERLDSAVGDSIAEETAAEMGRIIDGILTINLRGDTAVNKTKITSNHYHGNNNNNSNTAAAAQPQRSGNLQQVLEQMIKTLAFISEDGDTALHLALIHEHTVFLDYVLGFLSWSVCGSQYLDIQNDLRQTALHIAVIVNQPDSVRKLLLAGASPDIQEWEGNTALHIACRESRLECVKELTSPLLGRAQLDTHSYMGFSALHVAVQKKDVEIVKLLLNAGADITGRDLSCGRSALHLAVEGQSADLTELLLRRGAPPNPVTYAGHTPLYSALYRPCEEVRRLLREHGAQEPGQELDWEEEDDEEGEVEFDDLVINGHPVL
ncbi:NF-kappa-B inhibitor beta [Acipenser ruthenus]|uniref:NF-kappa-B inhibitor beta n=1 Tax=Acipenser ruthenus TaxID=7906 RepID=UPI0027422D89|nr:NF-kappa-B inhibitor beta [Acipenser ruthenus]